MNPHEMHATIIKNSDDNYELWFHNPDDTNRYGDTWISLGDFKSFDEATTAALAGIKLTVIKFEESQHKVEKINK